MVHGTDASLTEKELPFLHARFLGSAIAAQIVDLLRLFTVKVYSYKNITFLNGWIVFCVCDKQMPRLFPEIPIFYH